MLQEQIEQDKAKKKAELEHKKNVIHDAEERARHRREDEVDDSEVVDQIFGFLPGNTDVGNTGKAPKMFGDLAVAQTQYLLGDGEGMGAGENMEELKEYRFEKFATTYFQGQNTSVFMAQKLDRPLLYHDDKSDNMVSSLFFY